jgi:prefoldin subunit 5
MTERLRELEEELRKGTRMLGELDQRRAELRDTMLRISGAIQVLRELAGQEGGVPRALALNSD